MSNSIFYKALAGLSTAGILVIAGLLIPMAIQKEDGVEESIAQTKQELKLVRKEALNEVKNIRREILEEVKAARKESLNAIRKAGGTNKESVWLVVRVGGYNSGGWSEMPVALEKIRMEDMEQCELQGALWVASKNIANRDYLTGFECLEGK